MGGIFARTDYLLLRRDSHVYAYAEYQMRKRIRRYAMIACAVLDEERNVRRRLNPVPVPAGVRIDRVSALENWDDDLFVRFTRFARADLHRIGTACGLGAINRTSERDRYSRLEGMIILLNRLSYPSKWDSLVGTFERSPSSMSRIFSDVLRRIYMSCANSISLNKEHFLVNLQRFSNAIQLKGGHQLDCVGFIDGTIRPCCRPCEGQRAVYNGNKKVHSLKFQSVVVPDGLIISLYGP
eukprot:515603-Amorphochlora_amoeboformis.AAC.1